MFLLSPLSFLSLPSCIPDLPLPLRPARGSGELFKLPQQGPGKALPPTFWFLKTCMPGNNRFGSFLLPGLCQLGEASPIDRPDGGHGRIAPPPRSPPDLLLLLLAEMPLLRCTARRRAETWLARRGGLNDPTLSVSYYAAKFRCCASHTVWAVWAYRACNCRQTEKQESDSVVCPAGGRCSVPVDGEWQHWDSDERMSAGWLISGRCPFVRCICYCAINMQRGVLAGLGAAGRPAATFIIRRGTAVPLPPPLADSLTVPSRTAFRLVCIHSFIHRPCWQW